jgi:LacI family transcriptional regulator
MSERISIFEVAKKAQCSIATVSNVLNNKGRTGAKMRKVVLRAVQELGYQVSSAGRSLRKQRSEILGMLFYPSCAQIFKNPFYAEIMEGLEESLTLKGYHLLLAGYQVASAHSEVPDFLMQGKVDGMIMLGRFPNQVIQTFCKVSSPLLLLDSNSEWPLDSAISDGFSAEMNVVNYLKAQGHRNIVMLAYQQEDYNIDLRIQGFLAGLSMCGLGTEAAVIREWISHDDIYRALSERLKGANPPTAVVTVNDKLAMVMVERMRADGIKVPERVSIVGYDDDVVMLDNRPFLTTVRVDKRKLGQVGAELILKRIETPDTPVMKLRLPTEFVVRESVARIRQ